MSGNRSPLATLLRVLAVVAAAALVLAVAYVTVRDPSSGPTVTARRTAPPVRASVSQGVLLGRGHATMAAGEAGLWVARQARVGAPGRLIEIDTATGKPDHIYSLSIVPWGVGVGSQTVWVLGTQPHQSLAVLLRVNAHTGRVQHRLPLAAPPSCATGQFASCYPAVTRSGVWVPLLDEIVHVTPAGTMADRTVSLNGHVWDMTSTGHVLWVLAETAAYRIDQRDGTYMRVKLLPELGPGMQSNHIIADAKTVWSSSYPRGAAPSSRITQIPPSGEAGGMHSRPYPGAGSLALLDGGLWLSRYDGEGELDRLDATTGVLTGPFLVLPDDDPSALVAYKGELWVLSYRSNGNYRTLTRISMTPAK